MAKQPIAYDGLRGWIPPRNLALWVWMFLNGEEPVIADVYPEPVQLQDCPKDYVEELVEFKSRRRRKRGSTYLYKF